LLTIQKIIGRKFQLFNLLNTLETNTGEHFCIMEENLVVFTCPSPTNLDVLSRSTQIIADGTFLYLPKYNDIL